MKRVWLVNINKFNRRENIDLNTTEGKISSLGNNTGNVVWYETVKRRLIYDREIGVNEILEENGIFVIPMANQITVGNIWQLTCISKNWCHKGNHLVILGLGAQLTSELNTPEKLVEKISEDVKDALRNISKYADITVRGKITGECLDLIGVHNYNVLGCPSFYFAPEKLVYAATNLGMRARNGRMAINFDNYGSEYIAYLLKLFRDSCYFENGRWLMQTMWDMPLSLEGKEINADHINCRFPGTNLDYREVGEIIKNKGMIFYEFDKWSSFYRDNIDVSLGMRFHGNMIAAINGNPSIWITHDSRTRELCETISLPSVDIENIRDYSSLEEIIDSLKGKFDPSKYYEKLNEYKKFLEYNGISYKWNL